MTITTSEIHLLVVLAICVPAAYWAGRIDGYSAARKEGGA